MKKLILLCSIAICYISAKAQKSNNGTYIQPITSVSTQSLTFANVSGPNFVNGGEQHNYILNDLPSGSTVSWSVDGPATIVSGGNTTTATIFFTNSGSGLVTLRVTISDGVNPPTTYIVKKINVTYCTTCP
ncbi:MAG: hypothetical protein V4456_13160 [Bacteroidota bacterium]